MLKLSYLSYFSDQSFSSLKHAALYFDQLAVTDHDFLVAFGEKHQHVRWLRLAPEELKEQLSTLEKEGLVTYTKPDFSGEPDSNSLPEAVLEESKPDLPLAVSSDDLEDACRFLNLRPDFPEAADLVAQVSLGASTFCLRNALSSGATPSSDNGVVHKWLAIGCRAMSAKMGKVAEAQKQADLARLSMRFSLPAFEFATFEDMLEARWRYRSELDALREAISALATEVDAEPGSAEYQLQLDRILEKRVLREIAEVEKAARFSPANVAKRMGGAALLVALQSLLPAAVQQWLLGYSLLKLPEAARKEAERARSALTASPFSMLIRLRRAGVV